MERAWLGIEIPCPTAVVEAILVNTRAVEQIHVGQSFIFDTRLCHHGYVCIVPGVSRQQWLVQGTVVLGVHNRGLLPEGALRGDGLDRTRGTW